MLSVVVFALSLFVAVNGLQQGSLQRTNAQQFARGLRPLKPKKLYDATARLTAPPSKRSATAAPFTCSTAFQPLAACCTTVTGAYSANGPPYDGFSCAYNPSSSTNTCSGSQTELCCAGFSTVTGEVLDCVGVAPSNPPFSCANVYYPVAQCCATVASTGTSGPPFTGSNCNEVAPTSIDICSSGQTGLCCSSDDPTTGVANNCRLSSEVPSAFTCSTAMYPVAACCTDTFGAYGPTGPPYDGTSCNFNGAVSSNACYSGQTALCCAGYQPSTGEVLDCLAG